MSTTTAEPTTPKAPKVPSKKSILNKAKYAVTRAERAEAKAKEAHLAALGKHNEFIALREEAQKALDALLAAS